MVFLQPPKRRPSPNKKTQTLDLSGDLSGCTRTPTHAHLLAEALVRVQRGVHADFEGGGLAHPVDAADQRVGQLLVTSCSTSKNTRALKLSHFFYTYTHTHVYIYIYVY